jgi:hypothetical protein
MWGRREFAAQELRDWGAPTLANDDYTIGWLADYLRHAASPGAAIALERMNPGIDIRPALPAVAGRLSALDAVERCCFVANVTGLQRGNAQTLGERVGDRRLASRCRCTLTSTRPWQCSSIGSPSARSASTA